MTEEAADGGDAVDVAALVAEIEAEVARRRAAGEYPQDLLQRLQLEFRVVSEEPALDEMAHIETVRPLESTRPVLGDAVVFTKRALRRLMAWYVRPITEDVSRYNFALLRELHRLQERLERVETPFARPPGAPPRESGAARLLVGLSDARHAALLEALSGAPPGAVVVLGGGDPELLRRLQGAGLTVEAVTPDEAQGEALRGAGVRCHEGEPLRWLESTGPSLSAVVGLGLMPMLAPAELLRLVPLVMGALRPGGRILLDAPDPRFAAAPSDAGDVDVAMRRWVGPETAVLLCEAAGVQDVRVVPMGTPQGSGSAPWYAVTGRVSAGSLPADGRPAPS